jgi:hypothetical protein
MKSPESSPAAAPQDIAARARLLSLINAHWTTQTVSVATQLRLPELLRDGPQTADVLAQATRCHRPSLLRLLRALASIDLLGEASDGSFALTGTGTLLRSDVPGSLAAWAVLSGTRAWQTWGRLADCVRDGESVRKQTTGVDGFGYLENDPEGALMFNRAMVELTRPVAMAFAQAIDFSGARLVVDVGGGYGELIAAILSKYSTLCGILFELPHATHVARETLAAAGVEMRCAVVAGSFFETLPGEADGYLLKSVLHDWNDEAAVAILRNCRRAMPSHAKVLVIERIAPEHFSGSLHDQDIARSDLNMLVATGGRERTESEYRAMLDAAELRMTRLLALSGPFSVLEAARR